MSPVFISYSHHDRAYVERLAQSLRHADVPVWYDYDLETGDAFWRKIQQQIDSCSVVLVVLTPKSVASKNVLREIAYADLREKRIIPLRIETCGDLIELAGIQVESALGGAMPSARLYAELARLSPRISLRLAHSIPRPVYGVESIAWQPGGELLAIGNGTTSISLYNTGTGLLEEVVYPSRFDSGDRADGMLDDPCDNVVFWSPDGTMLASWASIGCGRLGPSVWDLNHGDLGWIVAPWTEDGLTRVRRDQYDNRHSSDRQSDSLISWGPKWRVGRSAVDRCFVVTRINSTGYEIKGGAVPLSAGSISHLSWSTDGEKFAATRDIRSHDAGRTEIWEIMS